MIDKVLMGEFVPGVLVDVRRHVTIKYFQGLLKGFVAQGQFCVLLPQVGFQNFGRGPKFQDGDVARAKARTATGGTGAHLTQEQAADGERRCPGQTQSLHKGATAEGAAAGIEWRWFR